MLGDDHENGHRLHFTRRNNRMIKKALVVVLLAIAVVMAAIMGDAERQACEEHDAWYSELRDSGAWVL